MKATIFDGTTVKPYLVSDTDALSSSTPYVWIDIVPSGPQDPDVLQLLKQMGFTNIVAQYTTRTYSSGMFQPFGDNMLGSTYAVGDDSIGPVPIHCVWNAGCFITIRSGADKAMAEALEEVKPRASELFAHPSVLPGVVMQLILDSIDREITKIQTSIDLLDGQIIVATNPRQITQLQQARAPIAALGMTMPAYLENLKESLVAPASLPGMDANGAQALQTYAATANDIVQRIDGAGSDIRSAIQDYQGQVSAAQGSRINQLTLVSTIFLPITFMTGYFGMNFQWLSDATLSFVSWLVLGLILPIAIVILSSILLQRGGFNFGSSSKSHRFRMRNGTGAATQSPEPPSPAPTKPSQ